MNGCAAASALTPIKTGSASLTIPKEPISPVARTPPRRCSTASSCAAVTALTPETVGKTDSFNPLTATDALVPKIMVCPGCVITVTKPVQKAPLRYGPPRDEIEPTDATLEEPEIARVSSAPTIAATSLLADAPLTTPKSVSIERPENCPEAETPPEYK